MSSAGDGPHRHAMRQRFLEALARRAAAHEGEVRRVLHDKLARLQAVPACTDAQAGDPAEAAAEFTQAHRSPLAELLRHLAQHAPNTSSPATPAEPEALQYFRNTWSRLSAQQRLTQSLAQVPENAGPLNSQQLVHRTLQLMSDVSPDYLGRFMSQLDTLMWLEQAALQRAPAARKAGKSG